MKRRTTSDLLAMVLDTPQANEARRAEVAGLLTQAQARGHVDAWMAQFRRDVPDDTPAELREYFEFALLGVCVGFSDRDLSPFVEAHQAIVPLLLDDIRAVYDRVKATGAQYSREEFVYRAYDYGIHKAYYLDWDLYGSHEMY